MLEEAWRLLVRRPSTAPALLPVAGGLLDDPADPVRLRAAHLLAVLGRQSARYADRLATLIDDAGEDSCYELFGEALRALVRIGTLTPAARAALRTVRGFDGRLARERNYKAFLQDEELRAAIEYLLALP